MRKLICFNIYVIIIISFPLVTGCKKLVAIDPPKSTVTTEQVFSTNTQAEWALSAVYVKMTHGPSASSNSIVEVPLSNFGAGLSTILGGLSSDEMMLLNGAGQMDLYYFFINKINVNASERATNIWRSAYKTIYDANAVIEGIAGSKPGDLLESVKTKLTAEALTLRALAYFYLVNFFGDVPLVLTVDFNKTLTIPRTPVAKVYEQLVKDLQVVKAVLPEDFSAENGERVRVKKWFAEALLARVYLYMGRYNDAINSATAVLNKTDLFKLENNLGDVFKKGSQEAIFQLKPNGTVASTRSATPEGFVLNPTNSVTPTASYLLNPDFINSFDPTDKRRTTWMASNAGFQYPSKYKQGSLNSPQGGPVHEYYVVMRLAELYLIRAEARLLLSDANKDDAIADLNALRPRTGLLNLPNSLTAAEVKVAIANERKFELFAEWGHRWFDLKRTGKAEEVLSAIEAKKPWAGDYQLLYPIPKSEIDGNRALIQNPQYDN